MRLPRGSVLIVASHNPGKVREIKALLGPHGVEPISAGSLGLPEPEETGATFAANAQIKALASAKASRHAALAEFQKHRESVRLVSLLARLSAASSASLTVSECRYCGLDFTSATRSSSSESWL